MVQSSLKLLPGQPCSETIAIRHVVISVSLPWACKSAPQPPRFPSPPLPGRSSALLNSSPCLGFEDHLPQPARRSLPAGGTCPSAHRYAFLTTNRSPLQPCSVNRATLDGRP